MEKGQRLKTTYILNDSRINLLKMLPNESSVEIEAPEMFKTFAFSKDARTEQQLDYLYFYTVIGSQSNVGRFYEAYCFEVRRYHHYGQP